MIIRPISCFKHAGRSRRERLKLIYKIIKFISDLQIGMNLKEKNKLLDYVIELT